MDPQHFDSLIKSLSAAGTRRGLVRLLASLPISGGLVALLDEAETDAAGRRKRRKAKHRHQTGNNKDHRKGKHKDKGKPKDKGKKPCTPSTCPANACGSQPDGCGGTLSCGGCGANQLCVAGTCQSCTVTCPAGKTPQECGDDLNVKMNAGATVYVCPGTYRGGFALLSALTAGVTVIGAGEGATPASNTVLDAGGVGGAGRVLRIDDGVGTVVLERLHITGGTVAVDFGAGILHLGTTLQMRDCTVTGNTNDPTTMGGYGGGIFSTHGTTLDLTRCTVSDNHVFNEFRPDLGHGGGIVTAGTATLTDCLIADNDAGYIGGGIYHHGTGPTTLVGTTEVRGNTASDGGGISVGGNQVTIGAGCRVTNNTAVGGAGWGGGISRHGGTVTLQGEHPSLIVVDNCVENCAAATGTGPAAVAGCQDGGTCP